MKKIWIYVITYSIFLFILYNLAWPVNYSPAIVGIISDGATGNPIGNVKIQCSWLQARKNKNGFVGEPFDKIIILTNKNGEFKLPSKFSFHLLLPFSCIMISVEHPLYKWGSYSINKAGSKYGFGRGDKIISGRYQNANINFNISLESMETAFINPSKNIINNINDNKIAKNIGEAQLCDLRREWEMYAYHTYNDYYKYLIKNNTNIDNELDKRNKIMWNIASIYDDYYKTDYEKEIVNNTAKKVLGELGIPKEQMVNTTKNISQRYQMDQKNISEEEIKNYKRELFVPYSGEMDIKINSSFNLGGYDAKQFAAFRKFWINKYSQLKVFPSNYDPLKYPHINIYNKITFGTEWRNAAELYISNPYLLVILSGASYTNPLETYCQIKEVHYKNRTIEEDYSGAQAAQFFKIFDSDYAFPGAIRIWVVNARDAGLKYSMVDKAKCKNIDFSWRNTPDSIFNSIYDLDIFYHVGKYKQNNISPDCQRSTLKIKEKNKYTSIYIKLWVNKPNSPRDKEDFAYIIRVIP